MYSNLDLIILVAIFLYVLSGIFSGFLIGLVRLVSLVAMILVLTHFTDELLPYFTFIQDLNLEGNTAYLVASLVTILIISFTSMIIIHFLSHVHGNIFGRIIGAFVGFLRASLVIIILIVLSAFLPATWTKSFWETSQFLQSYGEVTQIITTYVPEANLETGRPANKLSQLYFHEVTNQPSFEDLNIQEQLDNNLLDESLTDEEIKELLNDDVEEIADQIQENIDNPNL